MNNLTNEELIKLYRESEDENIYKYFFERNYGFIYHIANKLRSTNIEYDELIQLSSLGFIKAFHTFKLDNNTKFLTYAGVCMNNEILMQVRSNKKQVNKISFEATVYKGDENDLKLHEIIGYEEKELDNYEKSETLNILLNKIKNEKDREIIKLHFYEEKTQSEIAELFNMDQSSVSRLIKRVINNLKKVAIKEEMV